MNGAVRATNERTGQTNGPVSAKKQKPTTLNAECNSNAQTVVKIPLEVVQKKLTDMHLHFLFQFNRNSKIS